MSILIDKSTRLIVQGITGRDGLFHAKKMNECRWRHFSGQGRYGSRRYSGIQYDA